MNLEGQNIEYKRIWKDDYLKWVSGFANAQGGKIYIGIDDDMSVCGVTHLHQQMEDIPNKIITTTGIVPQTNHLVMDGKDVIEIIIEPCGMPISYHGAYYYRSGATKQELRGTALHHFLLKKMGLNWEDIPCDGASMSDIDEEAVAYFLNRAVKSGRMDAEQLNSSPEEVLDNFSLLKDGVPTNGAILLFGKKPQRWFVTSSFRIGRFGANDADLLTQDMIEGNILQMTDRVISVLSSKYLIRSIHYEGLERIEPLEIPEEALREIIYNSIVHRLQIGSWNQMSVYDDHIRLWNEGMLPEGYTVETLMNKHTSKPRNPKIAQVFYRAGFIEAWGRGYEKINTAFDEAGLKRPAFISEQGGITSIIPREVFMSVRSNVKPIQTDTKPIQTDTKPVQPGLKSNLSRAKAEERAFILEVIKANPVVTMDSLSDLLKITKSSVQRRLDNLVKEGKLRHIGPTNGGFWEVMD